MKKLLGLPFIFLVFVSCVTINLNSQKDVLNFTDIVDKTIDGVVKVKVKVKGFDYMTGEEKIFEGWGSGFIYDLEKRLIITNRHVVEGVLSVTVEQHGKNNNLKTKILYISEKSDVAIIQTELPLLGSIQLKMGSNNDVKIGEDIIAIGSPLTEMLKFSVTKGIVSGFRMFNPGYVKEHVDVYFQTDASINGGNSGGPMINQEGVVIGINSNGYGAFGSIGLNLALSVDTIKRNIRLFELSLKEKKENKEEEKEDIIEEEFEKNDID